MWKLQGLISRQFIVCLSGLSVLSAGLCWLHADMWGVANKCQH